MTYDSQRISNRVFHPGSDNVPMNILISTQWYASYLGDGSSRDWDLDDGVLSLHTDNVLNTVNLDPVYMELMDL